MVKQALALELKYKLEIVNKINKQLFHSAKMTLQLKINKAHQIAYLHIHLQRANQSFNDVERIDSLNYNDNFFYCDVYVFGHKFRIGIYPVLHEFTVMLPSDKANKMLTVTPRLRIGTIIKKFRLTAYE